MCYAQLFTSKYTPPYKSKVQGAEGAGFVELGEVDLVGEASDAPVAL